MGLLSMIFGGGGPKGDPPTQRQLDYAQALGAKVKPNMNRQQVSDLISKAKRNQPPQDWQRKLCDQVGLKIKSGMTRGQVKDMIDAARSHKKYRPRFEAIEQAAAAEAEREEREQYGDAFYDEYQKWEAVCKELQHHILIYKRGKTVTVDVAELGVVDIIDGKRPRIEIEVILPKLVKDRDAGDYLDWEKDITLKPIQILYHESLGKLLDMDDLDEYGRAVKRGLKLAKRL